MNSVKEMALGDLHTAIIKDIIEIRQGMGYTQKQLGELSGVMQSVIGNIESEKTNPQLDTLLKILTPMGMTLTVVPISKAWEKVKKHDKKEK